MCDYSLCGLPTRLAAEGEQLVVHRFRTGSLGLASPAELTAALRPREHRRSFWEWLKSAFDDSTTGPQVTAICIPPGAQLTLRSIPLDLQKRWNVNAQESVFFVQTSANVNSYRDAVQFGSGLKVLLQDLRQGMPVQVESLGGETPVEERDLVLELR